MKRANRWGCNTHTHTHTQVNIKEEIKNTANTKRIVIEIVGAASSCPKKSEIISAKVAKTRFIEFFVKINPNLTVLGKLATTNYIQDG